MTLTLIAVFGVIQLVLFLMHAAIFGMLATSFGWQWSWLAWVFGLLSLIFVSASVLAHRFCNAFVKWYYRVGAYWFGLSIFLYVAAMVGYFIEYFLYSANYYIAPSVIGGVCFGIVFLTHCYATWQTARPKMVRVDVSLPNLPSQWQGKKIIFVSDIHLGAMLGESFSKKVTNLIARELPEMVLIGGDLFDGVECHSKLMIMQFKTLRPPKGIYFSSGNHEYYFRNAKALFDEIQEVGIKILNNETAMIDGLQLVGVDWKDTAKKEPFEKVLANLHLDHEKPSVLMRHEPSHLEVAEHAGISLTLSGHTHAGQIWPLGYITRSIYKGYDYGLKQLGKMMVYTSSGVGTWGPPLRFGTKSEIVAITLKNS